MKTAQIKSDLKRAYQQNASDREANELAAWKLRLRERFLERLRTRQAGRLLEIGAGPGKDSLFFQQAGLQVTATDLTYEMAVLCGEKGLPSCCMDLYQLPFASQEFDAAWSMNCLLHVPRQDIQSVLWEIRRVLRPGGIFHYGVYGGIEQESVFEQDHLRPQRFFSFLSDELIQELAATIFEIESFEVIPLPGDTSNLHFQSMVLRRG